LENTSSIVNFGSFPLIQLSWLAVGWNLKMRTAMLMILLLHERFHTSS